VRVSANALAINAASIRVMEKAGLRFEKKFVYPRIDLEGLRYVLRRSEWRAR
jgi:RimJ/RimL family protein N-acetyltransferase